VIAAAGHIGTPWSRFAFQDTLYIKQFGSRLVAGWSAAHKTLWTRAAVG